MRPGFASPAPGGPAKIIGISRGAEGGEAAKRDSRVAGAAWGYGVMVLSAIEKLTSPVNVREGRVVSTARSPAIASIGSSASTM
jgi:hypothetical protein